MLIMIVHASFGSWVHVLDISIYFERMKWINFWITENNCSLVLCDDKKQTKCDALGSYE